MENIETNPSQARNPHWIYLTLIFFFALIGFGLCVNLFIGYEGKPGGMLRSEWFCGESGAFDYGCSGVFASRFGKPWGIPTPVFGAIYFGAILVWLLIFGKKSLNFLFALFLAAGALVSIFLLVILFFVLPGQCRWCLMVHLTNGLIILTSIIGFVRTGGLLDFSHAHMMFTRAFLVAFIMLTLVGWGAALVMQTQVKYLRREYEAVRLSECFQRGLYTQQKTRTVKLNPDDHILGSRIAPVKIVVYQDYECDHCLHAAKIVHQAYEKLNKEFPDSVAVIVRQYPLSLRCNRYFETDLHPYACAAAQSAEAVALLGGQEAFWAYHDLLHKNFDNLESSPYRELAKKLGFSEKSFNEALKDPKVKEKIARDVESMHSLGYKAVPAVFINGRHVDGWKLKGFIEDLARAEIKGEPVPTPTTRKSK